MKIAMIHWAFPPVIGGVETHLAILCPELVKRGHEVSLLTATAEKAKKEQTYQGVKIRRDRLMDLNWLSIRGFENLRTRIDNMLYSFIEESKPDVTHAHNMHYFSKYHTFALERIAKEKNIPLILTAHNVWDSGLALRLLLEVKWDKIIAVSDYIRREIKGFGFPGRRVITIHHGIDVEHFRKKKPRTLIREYPILKDKRIILHPARTSLGKGSDVSIKALKLIKKKFPDVLLILCGTGLTVDWAVRKEKNLAYLVHLVNKLGLEKNILVDSFNIEKMIQLYQLCDFSIYPTTGQEPFGLTMLESLACGKPMIVTRSGGMPEIIEHEKNGFIINQKDYSALAEFSIKLLKDKELTKELGENGRKMVEEKFTKEIMTDRVIDVYKSVLR